MSSQVTLFTGENLYTLSQKLRRWTSEFVRRHGEENLIDLAASSLQRSELFDAVATMPFIAERRLIVLRGIPALEKEDLPLLLEALHPQAVLLFVIPALDRRLSFSKALVKLADVKEFPILAPEVLLSWIRQECAQRGVDIEPSVPQVLLRYCGTDQWTLSQEIEKLSLYRAGATIVQADVDELAVPAGSEIIWRFTDLVNAGHTKEALVYLQWRLDRGDDVMGLWTVLLALVRNLVLVVSALQEGHRTDRLIAEKTALHPFVVRGLMPLARSFTPEALSQLLQFVVDADLALKTGKYHYSAVDPSELVALIERLILHCRRPAHA